FHREQRIVLAFRPLAMDQRAEPSHHLDDAVVLPEEVTRRLDAMRREIVHGAAAGLLDIPEVLAMRSAVGLTRAHPDDAADLVARDGAIEFGSRFGDAPVLCKPPRAGVGPRVVQHDLLTVHILQPLHVEVGHEAGAEHRNRNVLHYSLASVEALWSLAASSHP